MRGVLVVAPLVAVACGGRVPTSPARPEARHKVYTDFVDEQFLK